MPRFKQTTSERESPINLTPMLDVVFIMLIFFVVTATFVKEVGLDVSAPPPSSAISPERKSILVRIDSADRILIAGAQVDRRLVRAQLERLHAQQPEAGVVIRPHDEASTESIVAVFDAAGAANIGSVSLGM